MKKYKEYAEINTNFIFYFTYYSKLIPFPDAIKINSEILYIFYNAEFLKSDLHFTLTVHLSLYTKFSLAIQKLKTKNFL